MIISLDNEDIQELINLRNANPNNEIAFIVDQDTISVIDGEYDHIDNIPCGIGIIGHTHPSITNYEYNPPSLIDIQSAIEIPLQDWFIVDKNGIWIYAASDENIDLDKVDLYACAIINGEIDIETYLKKINQHVDVRFISYAYDLSISLNMCG